MSDPSGEARTHLSVAVAEIAVDAEQARVYEEGWQSWTPTSTYALDAVPLRARNERNRLLCYRSERPAPTGIAGACQGDGLLAVDPGDGSGIHVLAAPDPTREVPSIRAVVVDDRLVVSADGEVEHTVDTGVGGIQEALARWADGLCARTGIPAPRRAPTAWCSWYQYFTAVTETDVLDNLAAMDELELPIEVLQIDDGYQAGLGDWLALSGRFASLSDVVRAAADRGRRTGIWVAPFLVGAKSDLAADHPDWLVRPAADPGAAPVGAGHQWDQELFVLDVTHPGAAAYLTEVFGTLHELGIDYFKIDFVYAGALPGVRRGDLPALEAYRAGVELIRAAIGPESYLLGCGAPTLASVGLYDAMRVSPDTDPRYEPHEGDMSQPAVRAALVTGAARQWQHGRFWVNDPDCLIVRPEVERREEWAAHVEATGGLVASSDNLRLLDDWGLETTRRLLAAGKARAHPAAIGSV